MDEAAAGAWRPRPDLGQRSLPAGGADHVAGAGGQGRGDVGRTTASGSVKSMPTAQPAGKRSPQVDPAGSWPRSRRTASTSRPILPWPTTATLTLRRPRRTPGAAGARPARRRPRRPRTRRSRRRRRTRSSRRSRRAGPGRCGRRGPGWRTKPRPTTLTMAIRRSTFTSPRLREVALDGRRADRGSSTVSEIETSEVAIRSTGVRWRSKTSNTRGHEAVGHQHARLGDQDDRDALLERDGARLAAIGPSAAADQGAGGRRVQGVQDADRDAALDRGLDGGGVEDLGPEVGQLGRLVEADLGDDAGRRARRAGRRSSCRPRRSRSGSPRRGGARRRWRPTSRSRRGRGWW